MTATVGQALTLFFAGLIVGAVIVLIIWNEHLNPPKCKEAMTPLRVTEPQFLDYALQNGWEVRHGKGAEERMAKNLKEAAQSFCERRDRESRERTVGVVLHAAYRILGVGLSVNEVHQENGDLCWHFSVGDMAFRVYAGDDGSEAGLYLEPYQSNSVALTCLADLGRELASRGDWSKV